MGSYRDFNVATQIHRQQLTVGHNSTIITNLHHNNTPLSPQFFFASMGIAAQKNKRVDDDEYIVQGIGRRKRRGMVARKRRVMARIFFGIFVDT